MSTPVVFISRSTVKAGKADAWRAFLRAGTPELETDKPRTLAFLPYLAEDERAVTIVHVFADADAFDVHLEGVAERSAAAYDLIDSVAFEVYGPVSDAAVAFFSMAASHGPTLEVQRELPAGFLRLA